MLFLVFAFYFPAVIKPGDRDMKSNFAFNLMMMMTMMMMVVVVITVNMVMYSYSFSARHSD